MSYQHYYLTVQLFVNIFLVFVGNTFGYYCTRDATFGPCMALDAFPVLSEILTNLTVTQQLAAEANDTATTVKVGEDISTYTTSLCLTAQPIINCINTRNFTICEEEQHSNQEAADALTVYSSFRVLNYGCSLWLGGGQDIEKDCTNYDKLFDPCANIAPGVVLVRDFSPFFGDAKAAERLFAMPKINESDCNAFKLRTGCVVSQFQTACTTAKSADLPWWMARYQLDLSKVNASVCQFTSEDTAPKLAEKYRVFSAQQNETTTTAINNNNNNNQQQQAILAPDGGSMAQKSSAPQQTAFSSQMIVGLVVSAIIIMNLNN